MGGTVSLGSSGKPEAYGSEMLQILSQAQKGVKQLLFAVRKLIWDGFFSKHCSQLCI